MARYRHYRNVGSEQHLVFVTTTCLDFIHAFLDAEIKDLMAASLVEDLAHYAARLHAFVIMSHHIHFIAHVPEGKTISWLMNRIKSNSARRILPALSPSVLAQFDQQRGLNGRSFWQRSFRSFVICSEATFWEKVRYIHENPVRARLAVHPEDYRWSSARLFGAGLWNDDAGLAIPPGEFGIVRRWDHSEAGGDNR